MKSDTVWYIGRQFCPWLLFGEPVISIFRWQVDAFSCVCVCAWVARLLMQIPQKPRVSTGGHAPPIRPEYFHCILCFPIAASDQDRRNKPNNSKEKQERGEKIVRNNNFELDWHSNELNYDGMEFDGGIVLKLWPRVFSTFMNIFNSHYVSLFLCRFIFLSVCSVFTCMVDGVPLWDVEMCFVEFPLLEIEFSYRAIGTVAHNRRLKENQNTNLLCCAWYFVCKRSGAPTHITDWWHVNSNTPNTSHLLLFLISSNRKVNTWYTFIFWYVERKLHTTLSWQGSHGDH